MKFFSLRFAVLGLTVAYLGLALAFVFLNQPGNVPDEPSHTAYVRYVAQTGKIPVFERSPYWPRYTAVHPPLYYWLQSFVLKTVSTRPINVQYRVLRLTSVMLHVLALFFVYLTACRVFPGSGWPAVGATAFVALNPMFAFMGSGISNDVLVNAAMAAAIWLGLIILQEPPRLSRYACFGLIAGMACLGKMNVVVPLLAMATWLALQKKMSLRAGMMAAVTALFVAGPIFLRNFLLYGDPLAASALFTVERTAAGWSGFSHWLVQSYESFWAVFGWMIVRVPAYFYRVLWILGIGSVLGVAFALKEKDTFDRTAFLFLAITAVTVLLQGAAFGLASLQAQGRYLFVGLAAFAPFLYLGMNHWIAKLSLRGRGWAWLVLAGFALWLQWASLSAVASNSYVIPGVYNFKGL